MDEEARISAAAQRERRRQTDDGFDIGGNGDMNVRAKQSRGRTPAPG